MKEIVHIIPTAQTAYQRSSALPAKPSPWRPAIEKKIEAWQALIGLLEKVKRQEKLPINEKRKVLTFMSQEHLKMGNNFDVTEAISRCNEKILIFSKKLDKHEKRKACSRENISFEIV